MRRIVVIGTSGSGKTSFSKALARRLGIRHVEFDALYHRPHWTHVSDEELLALVSNALSGDSWVADGNYSAVRHISWARADTVVWLDYPRWIVMQRMLRRSLGRAITRRELWHGNRESFRNLVSRDRDRNIVLWAWTTHKTNRDRYEEAFRAPEWGQKTLVRLTSPRRTRRFVAAVGTGA